METKDVVEQLKRRADFLRDRIARRKAAGEMITTGGPENLELKALIFAIESLKPTRNDDDAAIVMIMSKFKITVEPQVVLGEDQIRNYMRHLKIYIKTKRGALASRAGVVLNHLNNMLQG